MEHVFETTKERTEELSIDKPIKEFYPTVEKLLE